MEDIIYGVHIYGNTNSSQVSTNSFYARNVPVIGTPAQAPIYPDIVKYWCIPPVPSNSGILSIDQNYCNLQTIAGRAFALFSTNSNTRLQDNYIDLSISTPSWSPYSGNGISLENGNGTYFIGNQIIGNNSLLGVNNQIHGMILKSSPNCHLECNVFKRHVWVYMYKVDASLVMPMFLVMNLIKWEMVSVLQILAVLLLH
ncbi:MAG: hypothetical protein HWD58_18210 [Bacteroidota bacterium]|nr:MAG: hypothetical protein HWD58_18210 [Bacteroidota bacterium]